ncbi:unnamed protein product [Owenia fusiformis]|uniref:G-protein coupled receptors family 1 profile domain-containing protein n=1 Tax=Owenia fusiformis TaxID=6347 RepID=A0A8S4N3V7_OWEFU|nr:unnamed protein product [Owenia fusiformis]
MIFNKVNDTKTFEKYYNEYNLTDEEYIDDILQFIFPTPPEWFLILLYTIIFIVGIVGNFLVCFAVWRNHHMRTVTNYFIVNLAIGDFLVILVCLPPTVLTDVTETWYLGTVMCKIIKYIQGVSVAVSVLTLSIISLERWYAICHPLKFRATATRARIMIVVIWWVSCVIYIPELVSLKMSRTLPQHYNFVDLLTKCTPIWPESLPSNSQMIYQLFSIVALYFIPLCFMSFTYIHIAVCLWSRAIPTETTGSGKGRVIANDRQAQSMENQLQGRRKAAKMLIAVVIMFAICYLPVHMLNILRYAGVLPRHESVDVLALISHWLCYFNSAINPVIYNFMSEKYRKEFSLACKICFKLCSSTTSSNPESIPNRRFQQHVPLIKTPNGSSQCVHNPRQIQ